MDERRRVGLHQASIHSKMARASWRRVLQPLLVEQLEHSVGPEHPGTLDAGRTPGEPAEGLRAQSLTHSRLI